MSIDTTSDGIIIRGQATLTWSDQFRFVLRKLTQYLWQYAAAIAVLYGLVWMLFLPDDAWLDLRAHPLAALGDFVTDAWPVYLGTLAALIVIAIASSYVTFRRFPDVNRQLSYEVDAKGILTKDAADFAVVVHRAHAQHAALSLSQDRARSLALPAVARVCARGSRADPALGHARAGERIGARIGSTKSGDAR